MTDSINRFTQTVENYQRYRPTYPKEILQQLTRDNMLRKATIVADVGSGTGLLTKLFLTDGHTTFGIEPNNAMRKMAEKNFNTQTHFKSINGTAENTSLPDNSVDLITAGTAFHWFDFEKTRQEFKRILKQPGYIALIWNVPDIIHSMFIKKLEEILLQYGTDYLGSRAQVFNESITENFFAPFAMQQAAYRTSQFFNWEDLQNRLLSISFALRPGDKNYEKMMNEIHKFFLQYQVDGKIEYLYQTKMYYGQLK